LSSRFRDLPIGAKLLWIAALASTTALVFAGVLLAVREARYFRSSLVRRLQIHAEIIGFNISPALLFRDDASGVATLAALKASGDVVGAAVYDEDGRLFAAFTAAGADFVAPPRLAPGAPAQRFQDASVEVVAPIVFEGRRVGAILMRASLREMHRQRRESAAIFTGVAVLSFLFALLISRRYQRAISRPVQALAAAAHRVSEERDYSVRAEAEGRDEVGQLVQAFNEMLSQIQQRDAQLEETMAGLDRRVQERTLELERELEERRRAEEEILRLNQENELRLVELTALNREVEAFSYSVSHDLRAPLRHVAGFAEMLRKHTEGALDEKGLRYLAVIGDGAQRMGRLIDDLLAFSRTSRAEMVESQVELGPLVDEVIAEIMRDADGRTVDWKVGELPRVLGDRAMLRVVLVNLLSNAFKYTGRAAAARVEVGARPGTDGLAELFVRDDGVGFDMRYASKLFGVFQRLHRSDEFEGTGIGLATVQRVVHRHGGSVWAESAPDQGATFFFTLRRPRDDR
jgi:signal transduction histidine kinase